MAVILVADDSPAVRRKLAAQLEAAGHAVALVGDGPAAMDAVRDRRPAVVVTDMQLPGLNGLELMDRLRAEFPGLPVVLCPGKGSEELAVAALKAGAAHYVPKGKLAADLVQVVEEVLSVAAARRTESRVQASLTVAEHVFCLANDLELVGPVIGHVESLMKQLDLFEPGEHVRVGMAVQEAVVNGLVHGNLEVSSDLKHGDWHAYHDAIRAKAATPPFRDRRLTIITRAVRAKSLTVTIRDEGPGFDPGSLPDPTDPANIGKGSGRGLLLIRTFFDRVSHAAGGNEIVMEKGVA